MLEKSFKKIVVFTRKSSAQRRNAIRTSVFSNFSRIYQMKFAIGLLMQDARVKFLQIQQSLNVLCCTALLDSLMIARILRSEHAQDVGESSALYAGLNGIWASLASSIRTRFGLWIGLGLLSRFPDPNLKMTHHELIFLHKPCCRDPLIPGFY